MSVSVIPFFHQATSTVSYVVIDNGTKHAVIIDGVLDFDIASGRVSSEFADALLSYIAKHQLKLVWILDTHAHADHLTAAFYLRQKTSAQSVIGSGITDVQRHFQQKLMLGDLKPADDYFDHLIEDNECLPFGESTIKAIHTPGHTDDSMSFIVGNNIFVGDTLFMPDGGTARCDFPGGSAEKLWRSIERIHALPDETNIWVCHDYQPGDREVKFSTTVAQSKQQNIHVSPSTNKLQFIQMREQRDKGLAAPKLLYPSLQVNLKGGQLPEALDNGIAYINIPLTLNLK